MAVPTLFTDSWILSKKKKKELLLAGLVHACLAAASNTFRDDPYFLIMHQPLHCIALHFQLLLCYDGNIII